MRKVTREAAQALEGSYCMSSGNTTVALESKQGNTGGYLVSVLKLHGNVIAEYETYTLRLSDCGWQTATTKERLNGILHEFFGNRYKIVQQQGRWLFKTFDSEGLIIKDELWHGHKKLDVTL